MTKPTLHIPQKDSPSTYLITAITDEDNKITVADSSIFQTDPNNLITRLTLGFDSATTETVEVTGYDQDNSINIIRKSDGKPSYSWAAGTKVARVFTARDVNEYIEYFEYLESERGKLVRNLGSLLSDFSSFSSKVDPIINMHNTWSGRKDLFRGNNLGSAITPAQANAIQSGTFNDLYLGDYWVINDVYYRIADFNYWRYGLGGNHLVIVPDQPLLDLPMDTNNTVSIPYHDTTVREYLNTALLTDLQAIFGNRIPNYYENLYSIEGSRYNEVVANVELMNESMVYGQGIMRTNNEPTYSINQFSLFHVRPEYIDGSIFWLRDQSDDKYCLVNYGMADVFSAGVYTTNGIRPCFPLCGIEIT